MKTTLFFIAAIIHLEIALAQSALIKEVFRLMPADKVFDLSISSRDSLLDGKTCYSAENDNNEGVAYNYGVSANVKDYLYVSMSFETGQRATGMTELRCFKMTEGNYLVIVSRTGGVWQVNYSQQELAAFVYNRNKELKPYPVNILPVNDEKLFMKQGIPDSLKKLIRNNSNLCFDLSNEKLKLSLNSPYISGKKELRNWLKGDVTYYLWTKNRFIAYKTVFGE